MRPRVQRLPARALAGASALLLGALAVGPVAAQTPQPPSEQSLYILAYNGDQSDVNVVMAGPSQASIQLFEDVDGSRRALDSLTLDIPLPGSPGQSVALASSVAPWACGRAKRRFVATGATPDGRPLSAASNLRTPACSNRLRLSAPRRVRPGASLRVRATDRWGLGDFAARLCLKPPRRPRACRALAFEAGDATATRKLRLCAKGRWRLELSTRYQRIGQRIAVARGNGRPQGRRPSVLLLGDSVMSQLVTPIAERFGSRVDVKSVIRGGSGLTDRSFDWLATAHREVARLKPAVAATLIGSGDGRPLRTPAGDVVECCEDPWIEEYARRTERVMRALSRGGRTRVVWALNPAPARPAARDLLTAVGEGVRRAAPSVEDTTIADLGRVISPDARFRRTLTYHGRRVVVRSPDGLHLSLPGADIAAAFLARALGRLRR